MAAPAAVAAAKAAIAVLTDEKARTAVLSVIVGVVAAFLLPIIMLFSLLTLPMGGLGELMPEEEADFINSLRGEYGLDQYMSNGEYLAGVALDYSGISFTDGQTVVHYYNQLDSRWKDIAYGDGTIGRSGCGPTALAIAVSSLTDTAIDPVQMSRWAYDNGYKAYGNGSYLSLIPEGAAHFGLAVDYADRTQAQKVVDALASGNLVIAIMTKGHFTSGGHFIVLRGVTAEGKILVADPSSKSRSEQEWPLSIIVDEARKTSGTSGPFWIVSR
ncbi:C39 family peptidase [Oscillospiraceae bacterium OttesenSCG-928-G22]|nr:C39 family peptidase [Oscillospiraceae bacterium OttesenSCG-928-G22]